MSHPMFDHTVPYGFGSTVTLRWEEALARTKEALGAEGFGVLSEIDLARTLRARLSADVHAYVILGACLPSAARAALEAEPDVGLLLPCSVAVYALDAVDRSRVVALDPARVLGLAQNPALEGLAADVRARLVRVLERLPSMPASPELVEAADEIC